MTLRIQLSTNLRKGWNTGAMMSIVCGLHTLRSGHGLQEEACFDCTLRGAEQARTSGRNLAASCCDSVMPVSLSTMTTCRTRGSEYRVDMVGWHRLECERVRSSRELFRLEQTCCFFFAYCGLFRKGLGKWWLPQSRRSCQSGDRVRHKRVLSLEV